MRSVSILAAAVLALVAVSAHAATKTVKDWFAVCDNVGTCSALGFTSEDRDDDSYIRITRQAGAAGAISVLVVYDAPDAQPSQTLTLALDGQPILGVGPVRMTGSDEGARATLTGAPALALAEALRGGHDLTLNAGGKVVGDVSLAGSAAVLLWVDDQQGRLGTVTALIQKGPKPASAVPGPKPTPVVTVAPAVGQAGLAKRAPKGLTKGDLDCEPNPADDGSMDIVARLAPGTVLWGPLCDLAAYNALNIFFVGDEKGGHLTKIAFPEPAGSTPASDDSLMNTEFDAKTQTLSAFAKARGPGDCGSAATWAWDGHTFRLLRETVMEPCRRVVSEDWPTLYVAQRK